MSSDDLPPSKNEPLEQVSAGSLLSGKYRLEKAIASGGRAGIWLATDIYMQRSVVVKLIHSHLITKEETAKRFMSECRVLSRLQHPNVVSVFDFGCLQQKIPYLVMEYVEGTTVRNLIDERRKIPVIDTAEIMLQLCSGLEQVHLAGIVHRDLKPENILLQSQNQGLQTVKIADFGIAMLLDSTQPVERITQEGTVVGTIDYMSPEQLQDSKIDSRSDIYTLGLLIFEMLTGEMPFENNATIQRKVLFHLNQKAPPPSKKCSEIGAGSKFDNIVEKCLRKEPKERYQTIAELKADLSRFSI